MLRVISILWLLIACATVPTVEAPGPPDWSAIADESTVQVVTVDPDGDERVTTVWLVVVDGAGVIRTGQTRWFANLERDPRLRLRTAGMEYPLEIELVQDSAQAETIDASFREKYGFSDRVVTFFRGDDANRMRLRSR